VHIKLTSADLYKIYEASKDLFMDKHNIAVSSQLYPLECTLKAFADFCNRNGQEMRIDTPTDVVIEPIE